MLDSNWIKVNEKIGYVCPIFKKDFSVEKDLYSAILKISARGVYEAKINGKRIGDFILAPGWTVYEKRIQLQTYDITNLLEHENSLQIELAQGWYLGGISGLKSESNKALARQHECAIIAQLSLKYNDGSEEIIGTDETWKVAESKLRFCDFYDGEIYDAAFEPDFKYSCEISKFNDKSVLIEQQGEKIVENERIKPIKIFRTPRGETVVDFGQNLTGYPEISLTAKKGEIVSLSFAEVLDADGNFYTQNYRNARCLYRYICKDGAQTHKPNLTFYGFRYIRIDTFPNTEITPDIFTAIVVHSELKRTGKIETSDPIINQLFSNVIWGQKGNFLDVPTDCPQRDERMGWLGDAQIFCKTASYNFHVCKFFKKWIEDVKILQKKDGHIPAIAPIVFEYDSAGGAAWSDAITIIPWQMYLTYGDKEILKQCFPAMKKYVDYITNTTTTPYIWTGAWQYGDWLELDIDAEPGEIVCKGNTDEVLIATAFYAHSTDIICKVGDVLGENVDKYRTLYKNIVSEFKKKYDGKFKTQGEFVIALRFGLTDNKEQTAKGLAQKIHNDGDKLQTGFVATPYLLHVLSENGESELAYKLLMRREYPSWLYPITKGATTMWEHWDGIKPDGDFWSCIMNSFNHYAYGAVADWMYEVAAGINTVENAPGFKEILFKPIPTDKIDSFSAEIETKFGKASSHWWHENGTVKYEIVTPSPATAIINGKEHRLTPGRYCF